MRGGEEKGSSWQISAAMDGFQTFQTIIIIFLFTGYELSLYLSYSYCFVMVSSVDSCLVKHVSSIVLASVQEFLERKLHPTYDNDNVVVFGEKKHAYVFCMSVAFYLINKQNSSLW